MSQFEMLPIPKKPLSTPNRTKKSVRLPRPPKKPPLPPVRRRSEWLQPSPVVVLTPTSFATGPRAGKLRVVLADIAGEQPTLQHLAAHVRKIAPLRIKDGDTISFALQEFEPPLSGETKLADLLGKPKSAKKPRSISHELHSQLPAPRDAVSLALRVGEPYQQRVHVAGGRQLKVYHQRPLKQKHQLSASYKVVQAMQPGEGVPECIGRFAWHDHAGTPGVVALSSQGHGNGHRLYLIQGCVYYAAIDCGATPPPRPLKRVRDRAVQMGRRLRYRANAA